jgi:hypothetical protein
MINLSWEQPPYHIIRATLHEVSANRNDEWALENEVLAEQLSAASKDVYKIEEKSVFLGYAIYDKGTNNFNKMVLRQGVIVTQAQLPQII